MRVATIVHVSEAYHLRIKNHQRHGKLEAKLKTRAGNIELLKLISPLPHPCSSFVSPSDFRLQFPRISVARCRATWRGQGLKPADERRVSATSEEKQEGNEGMERRFEEIRTIVDLERGRRVAEESNAATKRREREIRERERERRREGERRGLSFALWKSRTARART